MRTSEIATASKSRDELTKAHGTPQQFEAAVWAAWAQLFVTTEEAVEGIEKYKAEWLAAKASK